MPTYEYVCKDCGHKFEKFQSIKEAPLGTCPVCAGSVERLIGIGGGLIFKGSGFYITDYRSEAYKQQAKKESSESTASPESSAKSSAEGAGSAKSTSKKNTAKSTPRKNG